ncbi:MAG: SUMF1/EgtB/PvdO family nonheme iron enzyme, partial [Pseudomonadota bacterium]|nr:SUMF1/EgtB/PvdO family nonheme iron enzyme [Pseudomonadota bacterium]
LAEALERAFVSDPERRDTLARQGRLENDERALAYLVNDRKDGRTAFVLVVDQFEELFTFSGREQKLQFDRQLAGALNDAECPLFLISTVRIDYLDGFERLPGLSELYNTRCKRYLLKTISREGLREAIEGPAALAGLDVSEVTTAMLRDASGEIGALPLVENALQYLWGHRDDNRLSGALYEDKGGIAGLLESQADALLERLGREIPGGRGDALELLLALTRISDQGNHTRRRLSVHEARLAAGGKRRDEKRGQALIDYLSGKPIPGARPGPHAEGGVRLISVSTDGEANAADESEPVPDGGRRHVDLIHETLIRMRGKDEATGKRIGYWRTLYDYIEKNRDRGFYRDQMTRKAREWQKSRGLDRWFGLAGWGDLVRYRNFYPARGEPEYRYKRVSQRVAWIQAGLAAGVLGLVGQSYYWTLDNGMPPGYMLMQQRFRLIDWGLLPKPLPELVQIEASDGEFDIGELDEGFIAAVNQQPEFRKNFGVPGTTATIDRPFDIGKFEVTYEQYDYYVWTRKGTDDALDYPSGAPDDNGRGRRPVVNVSWNDANAYLKWLGDEYRLPTEAEWEYAARAGSVTAHWWGDDIRQDGQVRANCDGCGSDWDNRTVAPVGRFAPNDWGLYDTAGNVWEWTCSQWKEQFDGSEGVCVDPAEASGPRVIRGGSWHFDPVGVRSSSRFGGDTVGRNDNLGFRVLRAARTP